ncbi:MAG: TraR/DksA C4-type zinc finger protein [Veillonellales bacterium]
MDPSILAKTKKRLEFEKKLILDQISRLEETGIDQTMSDSLSELSVYDNHPADIGDELFERSKDTALIDNAQGILEKIEAALEKLDNGSYGYCDKCGKPIPLERLDAIPWVAQCVTCQNNSETIDATPRPLEEESWEPPFHRH